MTMTQDVPEGGRLAKVEAVVESIVRELAEVRTDLRELRSDTLSGLGALSAKIDKTFLRTIGIMILMWVSTIIAVIVAILVG
ncbi:MAG: hypothetical protein IH861_00785 [Chloroflexi bacterium]|nr:hypothetical protein [Chloroflexota bacterium]